MQGVGARALAYAPLVFYVSRRLGVPNCVYFTCPGALGCSIACFLFVRAPWGAQPRVFYVSRRPGVPNCVYYTCPGALGCPIVCILRVPAPWGAQFACILRVPAPWGAQLRVFYVSSRDSAVLQKYSVFTVFVLFTCFPVKITQHWKKITVCRDKTRVHGTQCLF